MSGSDGPFRVTRRIDVIITGGESAGRMARAMRAFDDPGVAVWEDTTFRGERIRKLPVKVNQKYTVLFHWPDDLEAINSSGTQRPLRHSAYGSRCHCVGFPEVRDKGQAASWLDAAHVKHWMRVACRGFIIAPVPVFANKPCCDNETHCTRLDRDDKVATYLFDTIEATVSIVKWVSEQGFAEVRSDCLLLELYNDPRDGQTVPDLVTWIRDKFDTSSIYFSDAAYGEFSQRLLERFRSLSGGAK